jgi:hypothetical protein
MSSAGFEGGGHRGSTPLTPAPKSWTSPLKLDMYVLCIVDFSFCSLIPTIYHVSGPKVKDLLKASRAAFAFACGSWRRSSIWKGCTKVAPLHSKWYTLSMPIHLAPLAAGNLGPTSHSLIDSKFSENHPYSSRVCALQPVTLNYTLSWVSSLYWGWIGRGTPMLT